MAAARVRHAASDGVLSSKRPSYESYARHIRNRGLRVTNTPSNLPYAVLNSSANTSNSTCRAILLERQPVTPKMIADQDADLSFERQKPEQFLGESGSLRYFKNQQGQKVATYYWPASGSFAQAPRGVIHLLHGHGSYVCYDYLRNQGPGRHPTYSGSWVEVLNNAGYSVTGIDLHGAGRSDGLRCYTDSFDHYVEEIMQHVRITPEQGLPGFPPILPASAKENGSQHVANGLANGNGASQGPRPVPRYIVGESMGGCLATLVSMRMPETISGIVLLAPMLSLEKLKQRGLNRILSLLAPLVSTLLPTYPCVSVSQNNLYPDLQAAYQNDPNNWHGKTRARNGYEYVRTTHMLMHGGMEQVTCPFLVVHGLQDDMCDPDGSRALHERAKSTDKTLQWLDHMWHVLPKEPGNPGLLADIITWLDTRTAPHLDPATPPPSNSPLLAQLRKESTEQLIALAAARPELVQFLAQGKLKAAQGKARAQAAKAAGNKV